MDSINKIKFNPIYIHPEESPDINEINKNITDVSSDLEYLDDFITQSATEFKNLLESTKLKINDIKDMINAEKEYQEDINILCNNYSDFSSALTLSKDNYSSSTLTFDNNILTAYVSKSTKLDYNIDDISGNGYAGNKYVYSNNDFLEKSLDTSNESAIKDNNLTTSYEYSRITISSKDTGAPNSFNNDSIEAECSIILSSSDYINKIEVKSDRDDLILKEIYISQDGNIFSLDKEYNISINKNREIYNDQSYIYGSGILSISPAKYVKLCFKSNGTSDDSIAYVSSSNNPDESSEVIRCIQAKRHIIKINDINLYKNTYSSGSAITKELITDPIKYISLFSNEYMSSDYNVRDYIKYYLIINGTEHEVVPINCQDNDTKIIRTSASTYKQDNISYLSETIKSAKLKVVITSTKDVTPYVSNIKILIGGNIDD